MENKNKRLILDFYPRVFGSYDFDFADSVISDDYIQHNPIVKTGKAGFMEFLTFLEKLPKPESPKKPFVRLICDGDFVAVHLQVEFMGKENAVLDLYRLENGKLAEHWDAVREIVGEGKNGNPVVIGPTVQTQEGNTEDNKATVSTLHKELATNNFESAYAFLAPDLIQHDPDIANGVDSFINYFRKCQRLATHRVIGEGDFVVTQSSAVLKGKPHVIYGIYRLSEGKIAEYWSVKQAVPEQMAHSNGMI
ncbi:hypothetical protein FUAX_45580 (plasmid) [Fulvitalea axinellae]|uniref:SnoaL-like domain-containing protein n=1 Tax=Fulvitalea axinellae TaxID=1182444 RepID=A0AAU9CJ31_9BACT|nr:hypothetical protein FUAX_45580 [Fulvitalea axinellae]